MSIIKRITSGSPSQLEFGEIATDGQRLWMGSPSNQVEEVPTLATRLAASNSSGEPIYYSGDAVTTVDADVTSGLLDLSTYAAQGSDTFFVNFASNQTITEFFDDGNYSEGQRITFIAEDTSVDKIRFQNLATATTGLNLAFISGTSKFFHLSGGLHTVVQFIKRNSNWSITHTNFGYLTRDYHFKTREVTMTLAGDGSTFSASVAHGIPSALTDGRIRGVDIYNVQAGYIGAGGSTGANFIDFINYDNTNITVTRTDSNLTRTFILTMRYI